MGSRDDEIEDAEWWEPSEPPEVPAAVRARARLAQAIALRDMQSSWRRQGRNISAPAPRLQLVSRMDPLWQAACGASRSERARAAEIVAVNDFIRRPRPPLPPLRSI